MKLLIALSCVAVVLSGYSLFQTLKAPAPDFGASAGTTVSFRQFFSDNAIIGGFDFATSSQGTVTYTAASFTKAKVIEHVAAGATTASLPTNANLSAAGFLPHVGDTDVKFFHASTTKVTLAGNTGVTLSSSSTTLAVSPNTTGVIACVRLGASEGRLIQCLLTAD